MSCHQHGYPWPSLATSPYRSSPLAGLQGYVLYPHIAAVCMFELVVLLLLGNMWGSIGVHHLWARPCFSSSVLLVWFVQKELSHQMASNFNGEILLFWEKKFYKLNIFRFIFKSSFTQKNSSNRLLFKFSYAYLFIIFTNPSARAGHDTRSIFLSWVWIQSFPSPRLVASPRLKNLVCPTIYP